MEEELDQTTADQIGLIEIEEKVDTKPGFISGVRDLKSLVQKSRMLRKRNRIIYVAAAVFLLVIIVIILSVALEQQKQVSSPAPPIAGGQTQNCPNNSSPIKQGETTVCKCDLGFVKIDNQCQVRYQWPAGTYGLPRASSGCPLARFNWSTGWRYEHTEATLGSRDYTQGSHVQTVVGANSVKRYFCMKTTVKNDGKRPAIWPKGQYCIYQKGETCPDGLGVGWVKWDDEDRGNQNDKGGVLPEGDYDMNTLIHYCCRTDGDKRLPVTLPTESPFLLLAYGSASCQQVKFALAREEWLRIHTEKTSPKNEYGGKHPYGVGLDDNMIHYCYYTSCNYTLTTDWGTFQSPYSPKGYPDGQMCSWRLQVRDGYQITLTFPTFDLGNGSDSDVVRVYDGSDDTAELFGEYSGLRSPPPTGIVSSGSHLFVMFSSDSLGGGTGFIASYTSRFNSTTSFNECTSNPCWNGGVCVDRPEGYTCQCPEWFNGTICQSVLPACFNPLLGVANSTIRDFQLSASSVYRDDGITYGPQEARGGSPKGWLAKFRDANQWFQIDFQRETLVTGLQTQGYKDPGGAMVYWVTSYMLRFSTGNGVWSDYQEEGIVKIFRANTDVDTPVSHPIRNVIRAVYLRILPQTWHQSIGMRVEVLGCPVEPAKTGPDILGHWRLDGTDASISLNGGPLFGPGRYPGSKAIFFNKTANSFARVPKIYLSRKSFTIACWVKSRVTPGKYQAIIGDWYWPWQFVFSVGWNREVSFSRHESASGKWLGVVSKTPKLIPGDIWTHVAVAWDKPNGAVRLYMNGEQVANNTFDPKMTWFDAPRKTTFEIGEDGHWTNAQFNGSIMDLYFINGAIASQELNTLRGYPKFVMEYENSTIVYQGDTVTCQATGLPVPDVAWILSGEVLVNQSSSAKVKVTTYGVRYACVASNVVGRIQLSVWAKKSNECEPYPCETGHICTDLFTGYSCLCPAGFTGRNCETEINECDSNPCRNGGTCLDMVNGYNCTCTPHYTGRNCELRTKCSWYPCLNGGTCRDVAGGYECACPGNYTGDKCQLAPNSIKRWMLDGKDPDVRLEGGPTYVDGRYPGSKALNFNKSKDCRAKVPKVDIRGISFTIAVWVKSKDIPTRHQVVFSDWYHPWNFWYTILKDRTLHFGRHSLSPSSWRGFSAGIKVPIDKWCHTAVTWNQKTGQVKFFVDGVPTGGGTFNPTVTWYAPARTYYELGENGHRQEHQFHGSMMDLNLLKAALTAEEINRLRGFPIMIKSPPSWVFGNSVRLTCQAIGLPTPEVLWLRSGVVLANSTSIVMTTADTYGQYTCVGANYLGNTTVVVNTKKSKECSNKTCLHGKCTELPTNGYTCHCYPGYTGVSCNQDINECDSSPCLNGGTCTNLINRFSCACAGNYSGDRCQTLCKPGWQAFNSSCFRYFNKSASWSAANAQCNQSGAYLASIHSPAENAFVGSLWNVSIHAWIGLNDIKKTGTHIWSDGTAVDYVNWGPGQPNKGAELAVTFKLSEMAWHDFPPTFLWPYVCRYQSPST